VVINELVGPDVPNRLFGVCWDGALGCWHQGPLASPHRGCRRRDPGPVTGADPTGPV